MIDLRKQHKTLEDAITILEAECKPKLREYVEHQRYSRNRKRHHKAAMKAAVRDSKGRKRR